ncbi:MAG: glycosyltransferase family 4 protein [Thermogutta sp.]
MFHSKAPTAMPQVVVVQIGSRRNYGVPIALEQAGALRRIYTDWFTPASWATRTLAALARWVRTPSLARASTRKASEIPLEKVVQFPVFGLQYKWKKYLAARRGQMPRAYVWGGRIFCRHVVRYGLAACDAVYCFSSVAKEVFEAVAESKVWRVLDQEIPPLAYDDRLVREQEAAYADWARPRPKSAGVEEYAERQRDEWALADLILCPSQFCRRALLSEGAPKDKIRLLPFGIHPRFFTAADRSRQSKDGELRVLFAANSPIRKGLPDLVIALEKLSNRRIRGIFAGELSSLTPYAIQRASQVGELLGNVPRPEMVKLYQQCDVFVLPTVSDVFPAVVLEAMAAGLPVIVTPNCGSADVVRDGIDGFIVPVRAPDAIAEKLNLLSSNPTLLAEMNRNAATRAREFTLEKYTSRLIETLTQSFQRPA